MSSSQTKSRTILITGCSSGFGLLTAARLAAAGHRVYATMRNPDKQAPLISEVNRRGGEVTVLRLDVTDHSTISAALQTIAQEAGNLDVLVNNAGYGIGGAFEDLSEEDIREQFETNFFGVQNVTRAAIPLMRQQTGAKIINMSSVQGFYATPGFGAYSATKWALEAFSESLRYELSIFGIDVLLIRPGTFRTKIFDENVRYAKNFFNTSSPYYELSQHVKKLVEDHVAHSKNDPEDVAKHVEMLINAKNPPFRSIPDRGGRFMYRLRRFLPFRVFYGMVHGQVFKGYQSES
ncbi:MAG: SDR family oxidoreductase [Candidatus Omnitrophica bacterium]|nr:SDR family oxidoreductase [Candidatus Omnitrophota bacterium]MCB9722087.1 SDR family oxidoreductase [Candidatus Omnitrophota bacterium]